ncbi:MAG: hypothetical protein ACJAYM_001280 [Flavobacteriales bacterium]|jgi:hypothetical protein
MSLFRVKVSINEPRYSDRNLRRKEGRNQINLIAPFLLTCIKVESSTLPV